MPRDEPIEIRGLKDLLQRVNHIQSGFFDSQLMGEIGEYIIFSIQRRTGKGKDVDGSDFEPYSPRYALFRQATGHPIGKVNLFYSGSMMSSMTMEESGDQVRVFFMNTSDRSGTSNPLKAYFLNKKRRFFAISPNEQRHILGMVREHINNLIEE